MKIINALFILITTALSGKLLSILIGGLVPGSVLGIIILFILLISGLVKTDTVHDTSLYLVSQLSLFILPVAISIMSLTGFSVRDLVLFTIVAAVSTLLTLTVTALVTEFLLKSFGEHENE